MDNQRDFNELNWAPPIRQSKLYQLYRSNAGGVLDGELIDDVGYALLLRCRSVIAATEAHLHRRVRCPRCARRAEETIIFRQGDRHELLRCGRCGWQLTWGEYKRTISDHRLDGKGALEQFRAFVRSFEGARSDREKLIAIDRIIHEFHRDLREWSELAGSAPRPAAQNLLEGSQLEIIAFLDRLTYGDGSLAETRQIHGAWRGIIQSTRERLEGIRKNLDQDPAPLRP